MQHNDTDHNKNELETGADSPSHLSARPLTRRSAAGEVLERSPDVERQIQETLALPRGDLLNRARSQDRADPTYLQEECLVYLIREKKRTGDDRAASALSECLLRRCAKRINDRLQGGLTKERVDEAFGDVVRKLFKEIVDLTTDAGDFTQVRFWVRLDRLVTDAFRKQVRLVEKDQLLVSLDHTREEGAAAESGADSHKSVESEDGFGLSPEEQLAKDELINEALAQLDERVRTAFILRYREGWLIESDDADEETISKYFKVTPRTIRNWLNQAESTLTEWRKTL